MNATLPPPPATRDPSALPTGAKVPIWDAPVRVMHWLAVLSFAGAWLTSEMDGWRPVHISFGLALAGVMALRVIWGLVGSRHARFASFVRGPSAVLAHFRGLAAGEAQPHSGHNPAGGWAVLALIGLSLAVSLSGWLTYTQGESFEDVHELVAEGLLALVGLHVAAVVMMSWLSQQNLVRAMVGGRKVAPAADANPRPYRGLGVLILVAVLAFWAWGMGPATPFTGGAEGERAESHERGEHGERARRDHDDD